MSQSLRATVPTLSSAKARPQGTRSKAAPSEAAMPKDDPQSTSNPSKDEGGVETLTHAAFDQVVVAHFSIVHMQDLDRERLHAMRDLMHRVLNTALSEWHRADKVPSKTNPEKKTLDRGPVTEAVKALLERERAYWAAQLSGAQATVEKVRHALGRAKVKARPSEIERLEGEM